MFWEEWSIELFSEALTGIVGGSDNGVAYDRRVNYLEQYLVACLELSDVFVITSIESTCSRPVLSCLPSATKTLCTNRYGVQSWRLFNDRRACAVRPELYVRTGMEFRNVRDRSI